MRIDRIASLAVLTAALLSACDSTRPLANTGTGCTQCHGGKDNQTGAPPFDRNGQVSSLPVGAHTTHIDNGVACQSCHVVPQAAASPGHIEGKPARVVFGGLATANGAAPTYASFNCSSTYCHGATLHDGSKATTVNWNADIGRVDCTSCHGYPPLSVAPHTVSSLNCAGCHPTSVNADSQSFKVGGTHLNGVVDVGSGTGGFHPSGWATSVINANGVTTPHGVAVNFHDAGYPNGLADCKTCHGTNLDGGSAGVACTTCHNDGATPAVFWTGCTFCHGDANRTTTDATKKAAPPMDTAGHTAATDRAVGAHQTHLFGRSTGAISTGVACDRCHTVPTDLSHVTGTTTTALLPPGGTTVTGTFDSTAATCSNVYCHGNFQNGKATPSAAAPNAPLWTATTGQSACGTCHSSQVAPDQTWGHKIPTHLALGCASCHLTGYDSTKSPPTVNAPTHVNGTLNIDGALSTWGYSTTTHTCSNNCHAVKTGHDWTTVP